MKTFFNLLLLVIVSSIFSNCTKDEVVSTGIITGVVTNANNVNISGASVTLNPLGITKSTGSDGQYNFENVEPGTYTLLVNAEGYQSDKKTVTVYAGQTAVADFMLGNSSGQASISPLTLSFGPTVDQLAFVITNNGNQSLQYSISTYPSYMTVTPASAQIAAKGKQSVSVKVNRDLLGGESSTQLTVNIGNDSYVVSININSVDLTSKISVSPTTLNFGESYNELQFTVRNVGTSGDLSWNIPTPTNKCLRVSPSTGVTPIGGSSQVTVTLDRSMMDADITSAFVNVVTDGGSIPVTVTAKKSGSGSDSGTSTGDIVVKSGLMAYYTFDGTFDDSSENGIHGYGINDPSFVDGIKGKAVKFSRTNDSKFVVGEPIIDSKEMTISFWGKNFSDGHIFHLISSERSQPMFTLTMSGGSLKFIVRKYNNWYQYDNVNSFIHPTLTDDQWHHIVLVSDFNKRSYATITTDLYVDGRKVYQLTESANPFEEDGSSDSSYGTGTVFTMGGQLNIGSRTINGTNMCVDNFRVYNTRMLSDTEIKQIFNEKQ